jgi:hypothetical protein
MQKAALLEHQSAYMQAPYLFPDKRWFFLVCGYGAGKTRANVFSLLYAVKRLQGKRDRAGDYVRLIVAGYTLAHLNKTFLVYLRQILDQSKTRYTENKKDNYFIIGTVMVLIVPLENPENILGFDAWAVFVEEIDELTEDKALEAVRALSERCRQQVPDERTPFLCLGSTSQGQKGLYRIYNHFKKSGVGFLLIRGRTQDNRYLPRAYVADMMRMYTPDEKRVFMDGEFLAIAKGRVLGDFSWERNYFDDDLDTALLPGEMVYIGMDFNCIAEGERVYTLRGSVPIESVVAGEDVVLTRQGFKKVLRVFRNGKNTVSRCATVLSTRGHIFRTPEGDKAQWQVKKDGKTYFLPEQESYRLRLFEAAIKLIEIASTLSITEYCITGILTERELPRVSILSAAKWEKCCISRYGSILTDLFRKGLTYTIRMGAMITGLRLLKCCLGQSIRADTVRGAGGKTGNNALPGLKRRKEKLPRGTGAAKDSGTIKLLRSRRGRAEVFVAWLSAKFVEKLLMRLLEPHGTVQCVKKNTDEGLNGSRITEKGDLAAMQKEPSSAVFAVSRLRELLQQDIVRSISIGGNGGSTEEFETAVYDLEVEDAHEYFVNGTLVHNTGYNRASAYVVRDGVIYCVKDYDFPDPQDAPSVFRHDFPEQRILWIPDVTIKDSFPQFARELRKYGIQIIYRKKNPLVEDTVFLVNKLFYTGRLMVCKIAKDLAEACALAMRDKDNKIPKGIGPSSPIHAIDGLRYACSFICMRHKDFKDIRSLIIDKRASFRSDHDALVQDLGGGYTQIDPNALYRGKKL